MHNEMAPSLFNVTSSYAIGFLHKLLKEQEESMQQENDKLMAMDKSTLAKVTFLEDFLRQFMVQLFPY